MNLVELIRALRTAGFSLEAEELADVLWLANQLPATPRRGSHKSADEVPPPEIKDDQAGKPDAGAGIPPTPPPDAQKPARTREIPTPAGVYLPSGGDKKDGLSFRTAGVSALPGKLAYARALRPLLRRVPSAHQTELDEEATVQRIADTDEWLPVMRPSLARWLELDVVVDEWPSLVLWHESIRELITLLTNLGAFRSVQVWSLWTAQDGKSVALRSGWGTAAEKGPARPPGELISVRGNRLVLVLSDAVSPAWYNGAVAQLLEHWVRSEVVTLFHLLPYQYWQRTGLVNAIPAYFRSLSPGRPNAQLIAMAAETGRKKLPASGFLPLPTLPFDPQLIAAWAQALAGRNNLWMPGVLLPLDDAIEQKRQARLQAERELPPPPAAADEYAAAMAVVERFRSSASPEAWKLAGYFSATVPLSLPLMRLVQRVMLPEAGREHLAEFYLSGLIRRVKEGEVAGDEGARYEFAPGVRRILFSSITRSEASEVMRRTSRFVSRESGKVIDFNALLADPALAAQIDPGAMPFAELSQNLLRALGGEYAVLADALSGKFVTVDVDDGEEPETAKVIPDKPIVGRRQSILSIPAGIGGLSDLPELTAASDILLTIGESELIRTAHPGYHKIIIPKEFSSRFGDTRILMVLPVRIDGTRNAEVITKIGRADDLRREKENYDSHIGRAVPFAAAQVWGYYQSGDYAALNYNFSGSFLGNMLTLEDYYHAQTAETINKMLDALLDKVLGTAWYGQSQPLHMLFREEYGMHLPSHDELERIVKAIYPRLTPVPPLTPVDGNRIQIPGISGAYPDPLTIYPDLLNKVLKGRGSFVHGNLHLGNVLVDESGKAWLIDFAKIKKRHNLFDFIKLEIYIRLMILSQVSGTFSLIEHVKFEQALNVVTLGYDSILPNNPELAKAYQVILNIRNIARKYMGREPDFRNEYFPALFLYSLSMLKYFSANGPAPTQLIFITTCVLAVDIFEDDKTTKRGLNESPTSPTPKAETPDQGGTSIGGNANGSAIIIGNENKANQTNRKINTGGGTYIEGSINTGGGDFVGRDLIDRSIKVGDISNSTGVAIGEGAQANITGNSNATVDEIAAVFMPLLQKVNEMRNGPAKTIAKAAIQGLETEAKQGEQAVEENVDEWFGALARFVPDIWDAAITALSNPQLGLGLAFRKVVQQAENTQKQSQIDIFVLMPFAPSYRETYTLIQEVAKDLGLTCGRLDDISASGSIMEQVENNIQQSRIIIADLSDKNPNVYFETGISAAKEKPIVLLAQNNDDIAKNLEGNRVLLYENSFVGARRLKTELKKQIEFTLSIAMQSKKPHLQKSKDTQKFCLAITANNATGEDTLKSIIQPVVTRQEMECKYVWDIYKTPNTRYAPNAVKENLRLADLIVTDLTERDADAYYLSGFAFGLNRSQIVLFDKRQQAPFDIRTMGIISYSKNTEAEREMARRALAEAINHVIPGNIRSEDMTNATPPIKASIQQAAEADNVDLIAELNNVIRQYSNGDLDRYTSDEIAGTILLLQTIRNRAAHEGEFASLLEPLSSVISHLSAAREYAIPRAPRNVEYYKSMRSVRHLFKQIKRLMSSLSETNIAYEPASLTELQQLLSSPLIRDRKAGIAAAAEMLANDLYIEQVRALLEEIAKNDLMITVQEAAQAALDVDEAQRNPHPPPMPDYVFSVVCPNGHPNFYDKREYCPNPDNSPRIVIQRDGEELDQTMLKCKTCGRIFPADIPCNGYK